MLTHPRRRGRFSAAFVLSAAIAVLALCVACDKVPLLAPTGTIITLFPAANMVPVNGDVEIIATVIENGAATAPTTAPTGGTGTPTPGGGTTTTPTTPTTTTRAGAGTPVQNGTVVSFTTTLGRIEPREARTNNGEVRVRFIAGGQSGLATITAYSGGASGRIENLKVGSAAVERVTLTASPQTLPPNGGTSVISAHVQDVSGLGVSGIPVDFTADLGTLSAATALTDANGTASVTLSTTRKAKVSANVAGKTADVTVDLNPRTGITIVPPATNVTAGQPATFTVKVAAGSTGANIQNVVVDYGDGHTQRLGAISSDSTVSHTYTTPGTYTVSATATDVSGFPETVMTSITVLPAQPPGVTITVSDPTPTVGQIITLTATASGATSTIEEYQWDFGDGTTANTTGNQITKSYSSVGTKVITVTVIQSSGPQGRGQATVDVSTGGG